MPKWNERTVKMQEKMQAKLANKKQSEVAELRASCYD
jgi:hypothetical protein